MNPNTLNILVTYISNNRLLKKTVQTADKAITYITVLLYAGFLIYSFAVRDIVGVELFIKSALVPGISFTVVSLFRKIVSAPRPYEVYGFTPAINKDTVGKSFPSRHVFSIFMISMTYLQVSLMLAVIIGAVGLLLAVIRVVTGVHFIKDVIAGALIAFVFALIGFSI
ncbi:MAG: phosphatase PAP2 family protein [Pseudobutyrivibrio sp.]|nr:phosphatase PAP2 family protein [Pseudobutyrivibrio sp.]